MFKESEQQDAHDFFVFLLDTLHEETNIKCITNELIITSKEKNDNDNSNDNNDNEYEHLLADQHWSNNIRNNASYIHSLYLGQLKSTLTCSQCHKSKISYETFSSLSLPIPEDSKMILDVLLFRLPFTLKPYYDSITPLTMNVNTHIRTSLKKIKANALTGLYASDHNNNDNDSDTESSYLQMSVEDNTKPTKEYKLTKLNTQYYDAQKQNTFVPNQNNNDVLYANTLNVNIPICIKMEICKKDKCENIIKHIQSLTDLELEQTNTFTSFLITNNGKYIDESLTIAECFIEGQIAYVYELLTYKGIEKIFKYNTKYKEQINTNVEHIIKSDLPLMIYNPLTYCNDNNNTTTNNNNIINTNVTAEMLMDNQLKKSATIAKGESCSKNELAFNCTLSKTNNNYNFEIILQIVHRSASLKKNNVNIFQIINYDYLDTFYDYVLLPNNPNCFRFKDLYDMLWEKYEYYLDMPIQVKNSLWWKNILNDNNNININGTNKNKQGSYLSSSPLNQLNHNTKTASFINSNQNIINLLNNNEIHINHDLKLCSPFVIKVINKRTKRCAFCPWLTFCSGCILGVNNNNITFTTDMVLVIEWCRNVYTNYIKTENIHRIFNHSSVNEIKNRCVTTNNNNNTKIQLIDCVDLFMQKEELNDIHCEKCQRKTMFKKNYEISRFPKHFIITLKRFKYTAYYRHKIHSLISFPLTDLDLSSHACEHINHHPLYDLYGVVNHSGSLNGGHYYSVIKQENAWIKYDDSSVYENKDDLESKNVYILVYQMKSENKHKMIFNYKGALDTAYVLYKDNTFSEWDALFNYEVDKDKNKCKEIHGKCMLYYGEPVVVNNKGRGFVVNVVKEGEQYYVSVKMDSVNNNNNSIVKVKLKDVSKETLKVDYNDNESIKEEQDKNEVPVSKGKDDSKICGKCVIM